MQYGKNGLNDAALQASQIRLLTGQQFVEIIILCCRINIPASKGVLLLGKVATRLIADVAIMVN